MVIGNLLPKQTEHPINAHLKIIGRSKHRSISKLMRL
jgi:hypothetical protein